MAASAPPSSPALPVLACMGAIASFGAMDAAMKALSLEMGTLNALFWRCLAASLIAGLLYGLQRNRIALDAIRLRIHARRALVTTAMAFLFFYGLARTPMAEAAAITFISPLIALYLAAVLLGERIGRRAVLASLLGLAGVVVIIAGKMGEGAFDRDAQQGIIALLASAVLYAWNLVLQREQAQIAAPREIAFFQNAMVTLVYALAMPFIGIVPDAEWQWQLIGAGGALAVVSVLLFSWGYARAEAQLLVPIEYSMFIWAALFGWLFFDEMPGWATLGGTVLILAGCWVVTRERPDLVENAPQSEELAT
ncbi:MAG: DMT family transporter [Blastomonas sp.]